MAKPKMVFGDVEFGDGVTRTWANNAAQWIAGRAAIDEVDALAHRLEQEWGAGRLRLLISTELREKFDRQRYLFNQAVWHGSLDEVQREATRMVKAWQAAERAAISAGAVKNAGEVWEIAGETTGKVFALVRHGADARAVKADGRAVAVYTLDEVARLLEGFPAIAVAKAHFPGAEVVAVRTPNDPLDAIADTSEPLDAIPF